MNSFEIGEFKLTLIRKLIANQDIVQLLDPNGQAEYPDDLIYENIFPYNRIPETEQEVKTYVTVMVNAVSLQKNNDVVRNISVTIRIYSHLDMMKVPGSNSNRIDLLSAKIDEICNESQDFGIGYMKLSSNIEHVMDSKHLFREMIFTTDSLNAQRYGVKQWM